MHSRNAGRCFGSCAPMASLSFVKMPRESWTPGASVFVFEQRAPPRASPVTASLNP
ncbi:carboxypeptidase [Burkholderia metallica]|nr:carboxypeptidase [Burkholderia metallica]